MQSAIEKLLRKIVPFKELGWEEIGEHFTRYQLLKTRWFNLYLHQLMAPEWNPRGCHDHPWWFVTLILKGGYLEEAPSATPSLDFRRPGRILYRPANFSHDVITPEKTCWSLVLTGRKSRDWSFHSCQD